MKSDEQRIPDQPVGDQPIKGDDPHIWGSPLYIYIYRGIDWCTFLILTGTSSFFFRLVSKYLNMCTIASKRIMHIQNGSYGQLLSFPLVKICKLLLYKQ